MDKTTLPGSVKFAASSQRPSKGSMQQTDPRSALIIHGIGFSAGTRFSLCEVFRQRDAAEVTDITCDRTIEAIMNPSCQDVVGEGAEEGFFSRFPEEQDAGGV